MENNNEMKINKLPAKTWYWLRMNDTALNWNPDMAGCSVKIDGGKEADKQASDFDGIETGAEMRTYSSHSRQQEVYSLRTRPIKVRQCTC